MLEVTDYVAKSTRFIARRRPGNRGRRYRLTTAGRRDRCCGETGWNWPLLSAAARADHRALGGKGGLRREVGMDEWAWDQLRPWLQARVSFPTGPLLCVTSGPTCGRPGRAHRCALRCDVLRPRPGYADASLHTSCGTPTLSRWPGRASPLNVIQRQLGHADLGVTSIYLQGIDSGEIIEPVRSRRPPVIAAAAASAG